MDGLTGFPRWGRHSNRFRGIVGGCEHCGFRNVTQTQWDKWGHIYGCCCGPCREIIIRENKSRKRKK